MEGRTENWKETGSLVISLSPEEYLPLDFSFM